MTAKDGETPPPRKANWSQVAATMVWGLLMIGKKGTWERDGATITLTQAVVGAIVTGVVVVSILVGLVMLAMR